MTMLADSTEYGFAQANFSLDRLWDFFDGDRGSLNIAHECIDRHATDDSRVAVRVAHADGRDEAITFREIARLSSQFAHWLEARGVGPRDRVAIMLDPSLAFYAAMLGPTGRRQDGSRRARAMTQETIGAVSITPHVSLSAVTAGQGGHARQYLRSGTTRGDATGRIIPTTFGIDQCVSSI